MRRFAEVLRQIAERKFLPDSLRSGYFSFPPCPPLPTRSNALQSAANELEVAAKDEIREEFQPPGSPVLIEESSDAAGSDSTSESDDDASEEDVMQPCERGRGMDPTRWPGLCIGRQRSYI